MEQKLTLMRLEEKDRPSILSRFIALDFETTGLDPRTDRIIEIGAVLFQEGRPMRSFSTLICPGLPLPPPVSALTGLTDEDLFSAPTEEEVLPSFLAFLGDARQGETFLCAHNARFDGSFLKEALRRGGLSFHLKFFDTLRLSRQKLALDHYRLDDVSRHFGIVNTRAHRAESDAETCGRVLLSLLSLSD